ncbi:MAG: TonB-dependent receptor [Bacteroidales bacterium]|nr:TonB-dependent receptor [Bacteroidales bacterium]
MKPFFTIVFVTLTVLSAGAQTRHTISGTVTDENGESLIGVNVYNSVKDAGTVTNEYGFYSLTLPEGPHEIVFSSVGYNVHKKDIMLGNSIRLNISLTTEITRLDEVTVTARKPDQNINDAAMGVVQIQAKTIKKIPVLMGETDVIKAIQLLPGVQSSVEGSSGFYVRGGNADQNLVLLDEATVYNPAHLFGFFSVFNGDALKHVELYKSSIPSKYGGRLSSVLDVRMKEGNNQKFSGEGGIGLISSRLTLEGPVVRNKLSYIVSGRRTYFDLFLPLATDSMARKSTVYFYDLNTKINWIIGENDRLYLSGYFGRDVNKFGDMFQIDYGNATGTIRWNHVYNGRMFSNLTLLYSDFSYDLGVPQGSDGFKWISHIIDYSLKADFTYYLNPDNTFNFGVQSIYHTLKPGVSIAAEDSYINSLKYPDAYGIENSVFAGIEQTIGSRIGLKAGLRFTMFHNIGKATIYNYDENHDVKDTTYYKSGRIFNSYSGFEPRIGIRFKLNSNSSIKAGYNHMYQYMHLASNSTATFPLDMWFMSSPNVRPQKVDQISTGYFRNFKNNSFETSLEAYYKKFDDIIDYKDHAFLIPNPYLEGELRIGEAEAYGLELMIRKASGKLNGWISYTWSRIFRDVPEVNKGKKYPAPYDKPHNINVVISYELNQKINLSANWVYSSAIPVTVPQGGYYYGNLWIPYYSERNGVRIPGTSYHRLDVSATFSFAVFGLSSNLNFSAYNVYNHHNAFAVYFRDRSLRRNFNGSGNQNVPDGVDVIKLYLFPIVPSFSYNIKF